MTQRLQIGFVFIIVNLGFGYLMYPRLTYALTKTGHWAVVLAYGLVQLLLAMIYMKGLNYFPKKDVIDILSKMGRWVAFVVLVPYVLDLTAQVALGLRAHAEDIISIFLIRTPHWAILILLFVVSTYTAIKGLGTILRTSFMFFFAINVLLIFVLATSTVNFDFQNALPAWPSSLDFLWNIKFFVLIGFSAFLFIGFIPAESNLKFGQLVAVWAYALFFLLAGVYFPLFVFGQETVVSFPFPVKEATDTVDIGWFVFNRQTSFFGISIIGFNLILTAVQLWMIGTIMHRLVRSQRSYASYWIGAFSLIAFIFAVWIPNQATIEKLVLWNEGTNAYFIVILPLTIFLYGLLAQRGMSDAEQK